MYTDGYTWYTDNILIFCFFMRQINETKKQKDLKYPERFFYAFIYKSPEETGNEFGELEVITILGKDLFNYRLTDRFILALKTNKNQLPIVELKNK